MRLELRARRLHVAPELARHVMIRSQDPPSHRSPLALVLARESLAAHAPPYARLLPKKNEETVSAAVDDMKKLVVDDIAQE